MIANLIRYGKEAIVTKWINSKIKDYGSVVGLEIDVANKLVSIELLLKGEKETFKVILCNYKILEFEDGTYFCVEDIKTEREWLDLFISRHFDLILPGKKIKFPGKMVRNIVKILL